MPNLRPPRGVSANPGKKKSSGLGSLLGGGVSGGGYTPAFNADASALTQFNQSGVDPTDEDASIDQYNQIRGDQMANGISSTPAGFTPYKVQNPILDQIFNRGVGSQQATSLNAQQNMFQAQNDAAKAMQEAQANAAMQREVYSNDQMGQRQSQQTQAQADLARNQMIWGNLAKRNVSPLADPSQFDQSATTIANNQDAATIAAQKQSWFQPEVANNVRAGLQKQGVENSAMSRVIAAPNTRVFETSTSPDNNGRLFEFPGTTENQTLIPEYYTMPNGQKIATGKVDRQMINSQTPGGFVDQIGAQLEAKKKALMEAATGKTSSMTPTQSNPAMSNTPQGFPVSATPSNTALLPQIGNSISSGLHSAGDYMNPLRDDTAISDFIRKLFNSNYKGSPVPTPNKRKLD